MVEKLNARETDETNGKLFGGLDRKGVQEFYEFVEKDDTWKKTNRDGQILNETNQKETIRNAMKKTMFTTFEAVINRSNSFTGFLKLTPKSEGDLYITK
jgi:hypothetical protein